MNCEKIALENVRESNHRGKKKKQQQHNERKLSFYCSVDSHVELRVCLVLVFVFTAATMKGNILCYNRRNEQQQQKNTHAKYVHRFIHCLLLVGNVSFPA